MKWSLRRRDGSLKVSVLVKAAVTLFSLSISFGVGFTTNEYVTSPTRVVEVEVYPEGPWLPHEYPETLMVLDPAGFPDCPECPKCPEPPECPKVGYPLTIEIPVPYPVPSPPETVWVAPEIPGGPLWRKDPRRPGRAVMIL